MLLLGISLTVIVFFGSVGDVTISILTFMAVTSLLLDQQEMTPRQSRRSHLLDTFIAILLGAAFLTLTSRFGITTTARVVPFLLLLGWFIFISGIERIAQYWKPLLLLFILALPDGALLKPVIYPFLKLFGWNQLAEVTAQFTTTLTNSIGIPAILQGRDIHMPNAIVTISRECDGDRILDFMIRLTVILIVTFPVKKTRWIPVLVTGLLLAFLTNGIRITMLTWFANSGDFAAFDYWHIGAGKKVFYLSAIILFCIIGYFQISPAEKKQDSTTESVKQPGKPQAQT